MEMRLLYISIKYDGYTMPIVTYHDKENDRYTIVDGFHRYSVMRRYRDIHEKNGGLLPVVVIDKPLNNRMASTIRHNRARGRHSIPGMSNLVVSLLRGGWSDARICEELGLEKDEIIRLKHVTGYAKFFESSEYSRASESDKMIEKRIAYEKSAKPW